MTLVKLQTEKINQLEAISTEIAEKKLISLELEGEYMNLLAREKHRTVNLGVLKRKLEKITLDSENLTRQINCNEESIEELMS